VRSLADLNENISRSSLYSIQGAEVIYIVVAVCSLNVPKRGYATQFFDNFKQEAYLLLDKKALDLCRQFHLFYKELNCVVREVRNHGATCISVFINC